MVMHGSMVILSSFGIIVFLCLGIDSYRHLRTVRTHLATLVLPWYDPQLPKNIYKGLTMEV